MTPPLPSRRRFGRTPRRGRSRSVWPACPAAHWSAPWCTASSSARNSTRRIWRPRSPAPWSEELAWRNVDLGDTDAVVARVCARPSTSPLGPLVDGVAPARRGAPRPARRADLRDPARRRGRRPATTLHVDAAGRRARSAPAGGRPGGPLRRPAARSRARRRAARLPDRQPRSGASPTGRPLRRWPTTRRTGWRRPDETLTAWHYRPEALQAEMVAAHYPLQARALLGGPAPLPALAPARATSPGRHLGGVLYLFVRGMSARRARPLRRAPLRRVVVAAAGRTGRIVERRSSTGARHDAARGPRRPRRVRRRAGARRLGSPLRLQPRRDPDDLGRPRRPAPGPPRRERPTTSVALGAALAARAPRLGHVCVDLVTIRDTASSDTDVPRLTSPRCPGPIRPYGWSGCRAARWSATTARCTVVGRTLYLDRLWTDECRVAARPAGPRRRSGGRGRRRRVGGGAGAPVRRDGGARPPAPGRRRGRRLPGVGRRRRSRHGEDARPSPASWPCWTSRPPPPVGHHRRSRWPRRPGRRRRASRRPCAPARGHGGRRRRAGAPARARAG